MSISAQPVESALTALADQADIQFLYFPEVVAGRNTKGLAGSYTLEEALRILLAGTDLQYDFTNENTVTIHRQKNTDPVDPQSSRQWIGPEYLAQAGGVQVVQAATGSSGGQTRDADTDTDAEFVIEEIIVTSQRRAQSLKDVPISISAFTSLSIERNMVDDLTDYFNKTPNVSYLESGSRSKRSISIRGVSDIGGSANSIAVYVDEFNISNGPATINDDNINGSLNPQLQDIERIEVLRGPQGTFFGRNAAAGAINITTKKPGPENYREFTAEYGRFNTWSLGAVLNTPVVADRFFLRASAYVSQSDGFVTNVDPAGGRSDSQYMNFRVAGRFVSDEQLTVDIATTYTKENQGLDATVSTGVPNTSSTQLLGFLGFTGPILDGLDTYPENTTKVSHNNPLDQESVFFTVVGRVQYDLEDLSIVSVTGFLDAGHNLTGDVDLTSFDYLNQTADINTSTFSQEMRFQSKGSGRFDWVVGGLYASDKNIQNFVATAGADRFLGLPEGFLFADGQFDTTITSYAIFGQTTWSATERLSLTLGGRYSSDNVKRIDDRISFEVRRPIITGSKSFQDFSPRFAASYALTDDMTTYFTVAKGYKAGGVQTNPESEILPLTDFAPETLWNIEGGVKANLFDKRLRMSASVFYYDWSNLQVLTGISFPDPDNPSNILFLQFTDNAASASNKGFELEFAALAAPGLEIGGGIGYSDAKYDDFKDAVIFGQVYDLTGEPLPRAPKWTLNADAQYSFMIGNALDAYIRAEWNYRSETIPVFDATIEEGFPYRTPEFDVWNFRAGVTGDRFSLIAYIENAFNKQYFTSLDPTFGFSGLQVHPSTRRFGIRLTFRSD